MFDLLTRYLLERKTLVVPGIGVFELSEKKADADLEAETIAAPIWEVAFTESREADAAAQGVLLSWISAGTSVTEEIAAQQLSAFSSNLQQSLANSETVEWPQLGTLSVVDGTIRYKAQTDHFSPFTNVVAKKIQRDDLLSQEIPVDHQMDTGAQMQDSLSEAGAKRRGVSRLAWILFGAALLAAAWYFFQNGCNKQATGNRQPVQAAAPGETYQLR